MKESILNLLENAEQKFDDFSFEKKNLDLTQLIDKKNEEIKNLSGEVQIVSKSQNEMDLLKNKMEQLEDLNSNENHKLKKKLEEFQISIIEKDKKLQVIFHF